MDKQKRLIRFQSTTKIILSRSVIRVLLESSISVNLLTHYKYVNQKKKRGGGVVLDLVGIRAVLSSFQPPYSKSAQRYGERHKKYQQKKAAMKAGSNVYIFWFCWWRSFNNSNGFELLRSKFACDTGVGHLSTDSIRRRRIIYPRANLNFKIGIEAAWQQDHVLMRRKKKMQSKTSAV